MSQALRANIPHQCRHIHPQLPGCTQDGQHHWPEPVTLCGLAEKAGLTPLHIGSDNPLGSVIGEGNPVILEECPAHRLIFEQMFALVGGAFAIVQCHPFLERGLEAAT